MADKDESSIILEGTEGMMDVLYSYHDFEDRMSILMTVVGNAFRTECRKAGEAKDKERLASVLSAAVLVAKLLPEAIHFDPDVFFEIAEESPKLNSGFVTGTDTNVSDEDVFSLLRTVPQTEGDKLN